MVVNDKEFEVIELLGKGKGGYSYLVKREGTFFVLKQIHHEPCDYYQFSDKLASELNDYSRLLKAGVVMPELYEVDRERERILKQYIPGKTVKELGSISADIYRQIKELADSLKKQGLNIDYYPTNFIYYNKKLYYIDYECNDYLAEWDYDNWGKQYW